MSECPDIKVLIDILLDPQARTDERDDAAMDLGDYNDERGLAALVQVASDPSEDQSIMDVCVESIASIFIMRGQLDTEVIEGLNKIARGAAIRYLESNRPEWKVERRDGAS